MFEFEVCRCRNQIEKLRLIMELTYEKFLSFTDSSVLLASQALDDALAQYRKCPNFDVCNNWGREEKGNRYRKSVMVS
ncbi:aspartyl-phosphate phosphatase Spo0E family protein [Paenibacillus nanensis]|uniref:Aspartyl-phosphate phosphatase Spo0E family protein n=1 Tax=Paenibacillus nanensis TaxID=393251 RepID=A0A3A1VI30_9BACL|nr:aspartyl-phosphate phosphatase Spo0E family protein [Paenibacillus nanensis]